MQIRQGDLYIVLAESIPKTAKKVLTGIVLEGEATGHHHRLQGGDVLKGVDGALFLNVTDKAFLVHEEHKTVTLKAGKYAVLRQREYMSADMTRVVVD